MASDDVQEKERQRSFIEPLGRGTRLRQYIVQETLGAGGFGITYRAVHATLTDKTFAIKEYFPRAFAIRVDQTVQSTTGQGGRDMFAFGRERFLQEAEILARCQHPAIVDVIDYFEENGTAYSVLSYVNGTEMSRWLTSLGRPPTQVELDHLVGPLLAALEALHRNNLLHRDIAPDNILVKADGSPCLIDFGAARVDMSVASSATAAFVKTGYSPPEQYVGRADLQGPWTDIYALGATLYRAVTGGAPPEAVARQLDRDFRTAVEAGGPDYRADFLEAVDWSLELKPENRPQTIAAWREMLLAGAETTTPPTSPPRPGAPKPSRVGSGTAGGSATRIVMPQSRSTTMPVVAAVVAGIFAVGVWGAVWWQSNRSAPPQPPSPRFDSRQRLAEQWRECLAFDAETKIAGCRRIIAAARQSAIPAEDVAEAQLHLGIGLKERGATFEAEEALTTALRLVPRMADAYFNRGAIYAGRSQHDRAIDDFGHAIAANPNHADALHRRALSLWRSGRSGDALSDANRALALYPNRAEFIETRAHIYEALGRKSEAVADFKRAIELEPNSHGSREALRRLTTPSPSPPPVEPARPPVAARKDAPRSDAKINGRKVEIDVTVERRIGPAGLLDRTWVGANIDPVGEVWSRMTGLPTPEGALVTSIVSGSPASRSDLKVGDIVLKAGTRLIHQPSDLPAHVQTLPAGTLLVLEVWRVSDPGSDYLQTLTRLAERGEAEAMTRLGTLLADGSAVARNDAEALRWFRAAAEKGHLFAMYQFGQLLLAGRGAIKDQAEGYRWLKKAAEGGVAAAMRAVAHAHFRGEGAEKSNAETLRWLTAAAEAKNLDAMADLGDAYWQGLIGSKDINIAIGWYRLAADAGHAGAMANMGIAHTNGTGVAKDPIAAASWYRKAAEAGNSVAMNNYAYALDRGLGISRSSDEAAKWMLAAIDQNAKFSIEQMQKNSNAWSPEFRRNLQTLLKDAGFYAGAIDGSFGAGTISAVQAYANRRR